MSEVTLITAFVAGVLALLSPCSALLVPSFFAYAFSTKRALAMRTLVFWAGLATVLVPLGMGSTLASTVVYKHRETMILVAGWVLIALGVYQLLGKGFSIPFTNRLQAGTAKLDVQGSIVSTYALGAVYGLAGFCSGPVLGAILTMAATESVPLRGGIMLGVYTLGMAAPLFVMAAAWDHFDLGKRGWLRGKPIKLGPIRTHTTSVISGALFVIIGWMFIRFDGMVGATGLFGDNTDLEFRLQDRINDWFGWIPGWLVAVVVLVAALAVAWKRARREMA